MDVTKDDLIKMLKEAYDDGYHDGHNQGIFCGHDLSDPCNIKIAALK